MEWETTKEKKKVCPVLVSYDRSTLLEALHAEGSLRERRMGYRPCGRRGDAIYLTSVASSAHSGIACFPVRPARQ